MRKLLAGFAILALVGAPASAGIFSSWGDMDDGSTMEYVASSRGGGAPGRADRGRIVSEGTLNSYNMVDYDLLQAERPITESEALTAIDKWQDGIKDIYWENYRGNNVRVEMLRNNRDLKEMRLKFVQSQSISSSPDGTISDMLGMVADKVMRNMCGRKAQQAMILYERPSVEMVKETTYDYYKVIARGASLKEYGFRCVY